MRAAGFREVGVQGWLSCWPALNCTSLACRKSLLEPVMEADLLEMQCAVLAALREVTGASDAGLRPHIHLNSGLVPAGCHACGFTLCARCCCSKGEQQVLHSCKLSNCSMLPCLRGPEFTPSCAAAACLPHKSGPAFSFAQVVPWAAKCWRCQRALLVAQHLAHSALPSAALQFCGPTATPDVTGIGC